MANSTQIVPPTFPFYSGDPDDDKADRPGVWLCHFELLWKPAATDLEKITMFELVLEPDSAAEEWWSKLDVEKKTTWEEVKTEFKTEWPTVRSLEVLTEARRETLMSLKVTEEEVGKIVTDGKRKEYTHVIWADKAEAIWRLLEDHKGLLIHDVRKNLPEGILDCIPDTKATQEDYKIFLQAVRDISVDKAVRHTKANQRVCSIEEQLSQLTQRPQAPPSPMSNLANRLTETSLYNAPNYPRYTERAPPTPFTPPIQVTPVPYVPPQRRETPSRPVTPPHQLLTPATSNNPFLNNTTPRQGTLPQLPYTPSTPSPQYRQESDSQPLAYLAQQNSRLYPDDESGHQNYERDMASWENVYGTDKPMSFNRDHLPLTPGTVALGSQECYGCGLPGHTASGPNCNLPEEARITTRRVRERGWRSYISKILYPPGSRTPIQRMGLQQSPNITLLSPEEEVTYDPHIYDIESVIFLDEVQGNGMESRR
jgi:hypothetical protein